MTTKPRDKINSYNRNLNAQPSPTGSSRETDSRALAACAWRLAEAMNLMEKDCKSKANLKIYGDAIRHNQRLWTIFQVALSDPLNPLPHDLKITLLNLSRYVDKTSFRAVGKYSPDVINGLININRIIAAGLSKQPTGDKLGVPPIDTREIPTSLMTSA